MIAAPDLVGTWRLLSWRREFVDTGEQVDALGADPVGFIAYGADGRMNVIMTRRDRCFPDGRAPSVGEKAEMFDTMVAYSGTYTVHNERVVHHVDVAWNPSWIGRDHVRFCRLDGSRLEISGTPTPDPRSDRMAVNTIVFERWTWKRQGEQV